MKLPMRVVYSILAAWGSLGVVTAFAESPPQIAAVEFSPAGLVTPLELRGLVELEVPGPYDQAAVDRTAVNLMETGRFLSVETESVPSHPGDHVLRIHLTPRPFAKRVRFEGETQVSTDRLRRGIDLQRYTPADSELVAGAERQIADIYERNGFPRPEVRSEVVPLRDKGAVEVLFILEETQLPPASAVTSKVDGHLNPWSRFLLWSKLRFMKRATMRSGVNDERWQRFLSREQRRLRLQGFREARLAHEIKETDGDLTLQAIIDLERKTRIRTHDVPRAVRSDVIEMWRRRPVPLTQSTITRLERATVRGLEEEGWLDAGVDHRIVETGTTRTLEISAIRGPRAWVRGVRFVGNESIPDSALQSVLGLRPPRLLGLLKSRPGPQALRDNADAIEGLYASRGFSQCRVVPRIEETTDGGRSVEFEIREGLRRHIGSLDFIGASAFAATALKKTARLEPGDAYWVNRIRDATTALVRSYRAAGFTDATVRPRAETHADGSVDVVFDITEGPAYRLGPVIVRNSFKTRPRVSYQLQSSDPGAPFDMVPLAELQQRLNRLRIFDSVRLQTIQRDDLDPPVKVAIVEVRERPTGFAELGFDLNTQRGLELIAEIGDRNVGGHAISLSAQTLLGNERRRVAVEASRHTLFGVHLFHFARASYFDDRTFIGFNLATTKVGAGVEKELTKNINLSLVYALEKQVSFDVEPDVDLDIDYEEGRIGSLTPTFAYDSRDDPFRPTRGLMALTKNKLSRPVLGASSSYDRWEVDVRWFTEVASDVVLATAVRGGRAWIHGDSDLPLGDRFYLGGANTQRGFNEKEMGPRGEDGSVLGGESFALANAELRFPIRGILAGGVFVDVGNVYSGGVDLGDLRTCVGIGLRLDTPVGPLRADVGFNIDRRPDEDSAVFHLALGHAF